MNNIKVSVIMPSLNVRDYIELSVRSVMCQTLREIEIICIDAGSTDGTLEIIQELMSEDSRIKLINSPVKSYGYQINYALNEACGEYIAIVETDDYVNPDMYEDLYAIAKENLDADIVKGNYLAFWTQNNGEKVFLKRVNLKDSSLYYKKLIPLDLPQIATSDWYLWTGIYKKSMLIENKVKLSETKGAAFQDIGFLHRSSVASRSSIYVEKTYYNYCLDREDSSSNAKKGIEYSFYEYKRLLDDNWNEKELTVLYSRMATYFEGCMNGIEEADLKNEDTKKKFYWFRDKLKEAIELGIINENTTDAFVWSRVNMLPNTMEEVYEKKIMKTESIKDIFGPVENAEVIIFGCGNYGYWARKWIRENNYILKAYSDNDEKLWGTQIDDIPVISPKEIDKSNTKLKILIANANYYEEIRKQLVDYGVKENDIAIF